MNPRERELLDQLYADLRDESDRRAALLSFTHPDHYLHGSANGFGIAADRLHATLRQIDNLPELQP